MKATKRSWAEYVGTETLFTNAIRLRYLIWTIQRYASPGAQLLETGFGSGTTAVLLADLGYRVTALDLSSDVVQGMRDRYTHLIGVNQLDVRQENMFELPWNQRVFDVVYHQGVLEHFEDEQIVEALKQQARVSHRVIFDVPNRRYGEQPFGDERLLSIRVWRRLISRAGLEIEETLGRAFSPWAYALPYGLFARRGIAKFPSLAAHLGAVSIFVCSPKKSN